MKKHVKLIELIGMFLALATWALDWWSVQKWTRAKSDLRSSIESIQDAQSMAHLSSVIQLEAAVTRSVRGQNAVSETPLGNYALAWKSSEVRNKWLRRTGNTAELIHNLAFVLRQTEQQYGLTPSQRLTAIDSELETIKSEISSKLGQNSTESTNAPVPDINSMQGRDAGLIDGQLGQVHGAMATAINETISSLKAKADSQSFLYRITFSLGATLLLIGKTIEWWIEPKSKGPSNNTFQRRP